MKSERKRDSFEGGRPATGTSQEAAQAPRPQEERLRLAVEGARLGTWHWNISSCELIWSDRSYEICGVPLGSPVTVERFIGLLHPDDREAVGAAIRDALQGSPYSVEFRVCWSDGSEHWLSSLGGVYHDADGKAIRMEGVVRDITERRLAADGMDVKDLSAARRSSRDLSRRLVNLQEQERRAIARELHDEIGQILTGLKLMLEAKSWRSGVDLAESTEIVGQLLERVSALSLDLRPPMLDDHGLLPTLLWHFERYRSQTGVEVRFHHRGLDTRLSAETEICTFRMIQEALTNVARHAGVSEATVDLSVEESSLIVRVEDQGRGFDPRTLGPSSGGLAGMRERVRLVGGSLTVDARPGAGTRLLARMSFAARHGAAPPPPAATSP